MRFSPQDSFPEPPLNVVQGDPAGLPLVVLVGATGAGKSELALALAKANKGAIITADSRQIYQGFDIGTAKPTLEEQRSVPHEMLDCAVPTQTYTLAEYQTAAREAIIQRIQAGYLPFLVGGTGLYVRAILDGLTIPPVPPDPIFRQEMANCADLHGRLQQVDPVSAERLHPHDRVRVMRALEVHFATGRPISEFQHRLPCPYRLLVIGVGAPRALLYERIDARVNAMLAQGFLMEVAGLQERYGKDHPLLKTLGYGEMATHLSGELSLQEAGALMAQHTRNYAKRQLTWFRADERVNWLIRSADSGPDAMLEAASTLLSRWLAAPSERGEEKDAPR